MSYYNFFDSYLVEVRGEGGRAVDQHRQMYDHFRERTPTREPDLVVELATESPDPDTVLGTPGSHYGRDGDRFVVRKGSNYMTVDADWTHITVSPNWEPFNVVYPLEYELRRRFVEQGFALVHASGVQREGTTFVFPAWRSAGKTNTLLSLLSSGGDYLADDRLWVSADGSVRGYPLGVNMQPHNVESFGGVTDTDREDGDLKSRIATLVEQYADRTRSVVDEGLLFLTRRFLDDGRRTFASLSDVLPGSAFVDNATLDNVVVLRAAPTSETVSMASISPEDALTETTTINEYEWNTLLREYFAAFDTLFPEAEKSAEFESVLATERRILSELFETVPTYRMLVPRTRDWIETGIADDLVDSLSELDQRVETAP
ncbi:hypothetical protein SAMN04487948_101226 [Halogranum amylolyticum]|uniref:HprK-related kinase B n=1 Tax=Halogranum amylolyticum TaxID=660520 RepID=A0A1H8N097_9EURY|nr:hypothetical protein [Halogranum amylolyticum]SEO23071.1 hypothetical protein SAMN04487948_101226 [Halogranum amylolyticum]